MQRNITSGRKILGWGVSIAALMACAGIAQAQPPSTSGVAATPSTGIPAKDNLLKMQRSLTLDVTERPLKEVIGWITEQTKAQIEPLWKTDAEDGLDPEALITVNVKDMLALTLLERVLTIAATQQGIEAGATWQFTEYGSMEIGLRPILNKHRRVQIYDINDLLLVLPIYDEVPTIDLQQVLSSSSGGRGGGGGGQSPFTSTTSSNTQRTKERETQRQDRSKEIIDIIVAIAEPNQWIDGGGDIPRPRYFQGHIIVDGPDYLHRSLNGYPWWPVTAFGSSSGGRRYVTMNGDSSTNKIDSIRTQPVTATTGGTTPPAAPGSGGR